jgi:5-methylcytosine-specific restriction endonuclease McrA
VRDAKILVNGTIYHVSCLEKLQASVESRAQQLSELEHRKWTIEERTAQGRSLWSGFLSLFTANPVPPADANQELHRIDAMVTTVRAQHQQLSLVLCHLYDYWPTYPPDWEERRQAKLLEQPSCESCGGRASLHMHHRVRIGDGGDHTLPNLMVLCEACHEDRHGGKPFSYAGEAEESAFSRRLALIREAIPKKQCIRFSYTKYNGEKSVRTIRPARLEQIGRSLCIHGWCYLREAERIFAIKRMRRVKAVNTPEHAMPAQRAGDSGP